MIHFGSHFQVAQSQRPLDPFVDPSKPLSLQRAVAVAVAVAVAGMLLLLLLLGSVAVAVAVAVADTFRMGGGSRKL